MPLFALNALPELISFCNCLRFCVQEAGLTAPKIVIVFPNSFGVCAFGW